MFYATRHRIIAALIVALSTVQGLAEARTITIDGSSFAAIAYSPATNTYAYVHSHRTRWSAEQAALKACDAPDARIAAWANNGFCSLALGDEKGCWGGGADFGDDCNNLNAMKRAIAQCEKFTTGARAVLCLSSDGQYIDDVNARDAYAPTAGQTAGKRL